MPKKIAKDILRFGAGSKMLGAGGVAVGKAFGAPYGKGITAASSMMPTLGSTMMMGHAVRLTSKMIPKYPKKKKRK